MKKLNILLIVLCLFTSILSSCSKSDDDDLNMGSISITADKNSIKADGKDMATFTIKDIDTKDITSEAKITVDGVALVNNTYTSKENGEHTVKALYKGIETSMKLLVDPIIIITTDKNSIKADGIDAVTFTTVDNNGKNITSETQFYIDGVALASNIYTSTESGEHEVKGVYKNMEAIVKILVDPKIVITADKSSILADGKDTATFTIKDIDDKDVTSETKITVDGVELTNNTYASTDEGEHTVKAVYQNMEAVMKILVGNANGRLYISSNRTSKFSSGSDKFEFKLIDDQFLNLTSSAKFYVDDKLITGNVLASSTSGKHKVYAEYYGKKSAELIIGVDVSPRNVLVEDYTASWCGYCPLSMYQLDELKSKTSANMVISAIHGSDQFYFSNIGSLSTTYNVSGYPTKIVNRKASQHISEYTLPGLVEQSCDWGLMATIKVEGNNANIDVQVESYQTAQDIKLVVALCDNNQLADQSNYYNNDANSPFYQKGEHIKNYQHNYILRKTLTDLYGDAIPNEKLTKGETHSLSFTTDVSKYNKAYLSAIAFLVKDGEVINVLSVDNI